MGKAARTRYEELKAELAEHDHAYYVLARPRVSDAQYDRLFRELVKLEEAHPDWVTPDSPSQRVGAPLPEGSKFERVEHAVPMISIESLFGDEEVEEFHARVLKGLAGETDRRPRYVCEPKWDGVSVSLIYRDGLLERAVSRGDGSVGEELTRNVRAVGGVPLRLREDARPEGESGGAALGVPTLLEVRGEIMMRLPDFEAWNKAALEREETPFANPRNAAAGTLKRLDPATVQERKLRLLVWELVRCEGGPDFGTHSEAMRAVAAWGFPVTTLRAEVEDAAGMIAFHDELEAQRDEVEYEMDGVVVKVDELELRRLLGSRSRTPRWACAHKFAPREETTRLLGIDIQVGRTGRLTPRARLEPVQLGGVTVQHATLHNFGFLTDLDVRIGDRVTVRRAGDVIPQVVGPVPDVRTGGETKVAWPKLCPVCEESVSRRGKNLFCPNVDCSAQVRRRVQYLASRQALWIEGLGEAAVNQLFDEGLLKHVEDVFRLRLQSIQNLEGWGQVSASKLVEEIARAKKPTFEKFLIALGIPDVGETAARGLSSRFSSWRDFEACCAAARDYAQFLDWDGIVRKVARAIRTGLNRKYVDGLRPELLSTRNILYSSSKAKKKIGERPFRTSITRLEAVEFMSRWRAALGEPKGGAIPTSWAAADEVIWARIQENARVLLRTYLAERPVSVVDEAEVMFTDESGRVFPDPDSLGPSRVLSEEGMTELMNSASAASYLASATAVDDVAVVSLSSSFGSPRFARAMRAMEEAGLEVLMPNRASGGALSGLRFVLTGTFSVPRSSLKELIEEAGAALGSSVSKTSDYVVVGENPGSKAAKAESLGVPQLTETEFLAMLSGHGNRSL